MPILEIKNLTHTYGIGTPFQRSAVEDVSFSIEEEIGRASCRERV